MWFPLRRVPRRGFEGGFFEIPALRDKARFKRKIERKNRWLGRWLTNFLNFVTQQGISAQQDLQERCLKTLAEHYTAFW
jgi:hypothetical protein